MTKYNPNKHHRKSIRLKGHDYSQAGLYFITICVQDRACLFGKVVNGEMKLNDAGVMVKNEWLKLPQRFPNIQLHEFVVMPNHIHGILILNKPVDLNGDRNGNGNDNGIGGAIGGVDTITRNKLVYILKTRVVAGGNH